jgi:hypothetical protein
MDGAELEVFDKMSLKLIMKVQRSPNRLYQIELKEASPTCLLTSLEDPAWLWHARLGHVNFQAVKMLVDKNMAAGVPPISHPDQLCHGCLAEKADALAVPTSGAIPGGGAAWTSACRLVWAHHSIDSSG